MSESKAVNRIPDESWFSVQELGMGTWSISEPHHYEDGHFYLLKSDDEALLVDCGLGVLPLAPLVRSLVGRETSVRLALTHTHWDHIGALREYPNFCVHKAECDLSHPPLPLDKPALRAFVTEAGTALPEGFDLDGYHAEPLAAAHNLSDGDEVRVGKRCLEVLHTPGHSPGSVCYLEQETGDLFCGDLLYEGPIYLQFDGCDLEDFAVSARRIANLVERGVVQRIWSGHNKIPLEPKFAVLVADAAESVRGKAVVGNRYEFGDFSLCL